MKTLLIALLIFAAAPALAQHKRSAPDTSRHFAPHRFDTSKHYVPLTHAQMKAHVDSLARADSASGHPERWGRFARKAAHAKQQAWLRRYGLDDSTLIAKHIRKPTIP